MSFRSNDTGNGGKSKRGWVDKNNHYERYYCEICNTWMASDKASILTHRNGKKHLDSARLEQSRKLIASTAHEKQQSALQASLKQMETAAQASAQQDYSLFAGAMSIEPVLNHIVTSQNNMFSKFNPTNISQNINQTLPPMQTSSDNLNQPSVEQEREEWDDRKKVRKEEKRKHRNDNDGDNDESTPKYKRRKVTIGKNDGHYSTGDDVVWLDGVVFGEILEDDMPIQIWIGNSTATENELKLPENQRHWKDGMIVATRHPQSPDNYDDRIVVDVAYLDNPDDTDECLKKSTRLRHIRILLGNNADDRIPTTLEEARVLTMGGEAIQPTHLESSVSTIDEATGLSGWSTLQIKRTTVRNELKAERDLLRKERKDATAKAVKIAKDVEMRRMEEAKTSNADDSALGAYDIWGRTKDGYKGVQIHSTDSSNAPNISAHDYGKKLAVNGASTTFRSKANCAFAKKRHNRRTTSADDD